MKTILKSDRTIFSLIFFFGCLFFALGLIFVPKTFAEDEDSLDESAVSIVSSERFVTIFDGDAKKTVKTNAQSVGELLERLNISLSETDSVSPSLETAIDADNFFVNIYRSRPVLIIDGSVSKVVNTSSFDPKVVVRTAGFTVYDEDEVRLGTANNFLSTGISSAYEIIRGDGETITLEEDINFPTETIRDYNLPVDSEEVRQLGELGKLKRVYKVNRLDGEEVKRELVSEEVVREPVTRIVAVGTAIKNASPLTAGMGRNRYTAKNLAGSYVERQETFYDLPMNNVMGFCGKSSYTVRADGAKVDDDGYILVAANLSRYPRCSVVETSLGLGKVYDTGSFATSNPEQFDLATDWSNHNGI